VLIAPTFSNLCVTLNRKEIGKRCQNHVDRPLEDIAYYSVLFWRFSLRFKVTEVSKNRSKYFETDSTKICVAIVEKSSFPSKNAVLYGPERTHTRNPLSGTYD